MDPADRLTAGHDAFQSIHEGLSNQHPQENGTLCNMNQIRSQRIHRGFHRIGAVLSGLIIILGAGGLGVVAVGVLFFDLQTPKAIEVFGLGSGYLAAAAGAYALSRVIGWIIVGFAGD